MKRSRTCNNRDKKSKNVGRREMSRGIRRGSVVANTASKTHQSGLVLGGDSLGEVRVVALHVPGAKHGIEVPAKETKKKKK
jgi:hypothetical protein